MMSSLVSARSAGPYCAHRSRLLKSLTRTREVERMPASTTLPSTTKLPQTATSFAIGGVPPTETNDPEVPSHFLGMSVLFTPINQLMPAAGNTAKRAGLSASFVKLKAPEMSVQPLPTSCDHFVSVAATMRWLPATVL